MLLTEKQGRASVARVMSGGRGILVHRPVAPVTLEYHKIVDPGLHKVLKVVVVEKFGHVYPFGCIKGRLCLRYIPAPAPELEFQLPGYVMPIRVLFLVLTRQV